MRRWDELVAFAGHKQGRNEAIAYVLYWPQFQYVQAAPLVNCVPQHPDETLDENLRLVFELRFVDDLACQALEAGEGAVQHHGRDAGIPVAMEQRRRRAHGPPPQCDSRRPSTRAEVADHLSQVVLLIVPERDVFALRQATAGKVEGKKCAAHLQQHGQEIDGLQPAGGVPMHVHDARQLLLRALRIGGLPPTALQSEAAGVADLQVGAVEFPAGDGELCGAQILESVLRTGRANDCVDELAIPIAELAEEARPLCSGGLPGPPARRRLGRRLRRWPPGSVAPRARC
mmetsp:Transcript_6631/g.18437  ORF Transcript_6631/g.18437 Transcript_6631/m.18437 type:complete len:287 (-) Transcript_6631:194-1054(-)